TCGVCRSLPVVSNPVENSTQQRLEPWHAMVGAEAGEVALQGPVVPIPPIEDAADCFQGPLAVAFRDRQAGAVAFDAMTDAFALRGQAGNVEGRGLAKRAAAALEAFIRRPSDIEGAEDVIEILLRRDAAAGQGELEIVDLAACDAAGGSLDQRVLL